MSDFQTALEIVHRALRDLHGRGAPLRASVESLALLAARVDPIPDVQKPAARDAAPLAFAPSRAIEPVARVAPRPAALPPLAELEPFILPPDDLARSKTDRLAALREPALICTRCPHLVRSRTQVVFGVGNAEAELMFVGEAPGEEEDQQGEPFVGKAGQLLTKIIETMGFRRDEIYIANVLKCRPDLPAGMPGNRKPKPEEMRTCLPWLERQIDIIQPRFLVALGATAMEGLLAETVPMARLRGRWHEFRGIPLMPTYHPAYLLRNQALSEKRKVWEDMLLVLEKMERPISAKQRGFFLAKA